MRLPKHKLPKNVNKTERSAKHKDSDKRKERNKLRAEKENAMETEDNSVLGNSSLSIEEKELKRHDRKKRNASKNLYKKNILSRTGKNGPRAISKSSWL